jgi:hypothetical protein
MYFAMLHFVMAFHQVCRGNNFTDSFLFAGLGFVAYLFEYVLVFDPAYYFFWQITSQKFGISLIRQIFLE